MVAGITCPSGNRTPIVRPTRPDRGLIPTTPRVAGIARKGKGRGRAIRSSSDRAKAAARARGTRSLERVVRATGAAGARDSPRVAEGGNALANLNRKTPRAATCGPWRFRFVGCNALDRACSAYSLCSAWYSFSNV